MKNDGPVTIIMDSKTRNNGHCKKLKKGRHFGSINFYWGFLFFFFRILMKMTNMLFLTEEVGEVGFGLMAREYGDNSKKKIRPKEKSSRRVTLADCLFCVGLYRQSNLDRPTSAFEKRYREKTQRDSHSVTKKMTSFKVKVVF